MTAITGTIKNSAGVALSGRLRVTLDAPIVDTSTTPDSVHTMEPDDFTIVAGVVNISLLESETSNVTYRFQFFTSETVTRFYLQDGTLYSGPRVLHTDSRWYTGQTYTVDSLLLSEQDEEEETQVSDFRAIVPNQASIDYAQLLPSGIATDTLDTAIRRLAELLTSNADYALALRGGPRSQGTYNPAAFYQRDDMVELDGSSYVYINDTVSAGNAPPNATYWQLLAARGATGTGTAGNDTPYDATVWNGQTDAPSRNAVRDVIETLAKTSDIAGLAPLNSPTFTGNPSRNASPSASDNSLQIPTTSWVRGYAAPLVSPAFTGTPSAPTQAVTDRSGKLATTDFVHDFHEQNNLGTLFTATRSGIGVNQSLGAGSQNTLIFNAEIDPDSRYNASTGIFTVATGAAYRVSAGIYITAGSNITELQCALWNISAGTIAAILFYHRNIGAIDFSGSGLVDLALSPGTNYALRAFVNSGVTSPTFAGAIGSNPIVNFLTLQRLSI